MKKIFTNPTRVQCLIDDDGISFYGGDQEVFFPYGSIDTLHMSILGVLQVTHRAQVCNFAVNRADRAEMKEAFAFAKEANQKAPAREPEFIKIRQEAQVPVDLPVEEQLKQYKTLFVQGAISKAEYDAKKRLLKAK